MTPQALMMSLPVWHTWVQVITDHLVQHDLLSEFANIEVRL
jgi:hypothetical protein